MSKEALDWAAIFTAAKFTANKTDGVLHLTKPPSKTWEIISKIRWVLVVLVVLSPSILWFGEASESKTVAVMFAGGSLAFTAAMMMMVGYQRYFAYQLPSPYIQLKSSLKIFPETAPHRLEVDGTAMGKGPIDLVVSAATVTVQMNGVTKTKVYNYVSIVLSDVVVRIETYVGDDDATRSKAALLSQALMEALGLPNCFVAQEPALEQSAAAMYGGALLALCETGIVVGGYTTAFSAENVALWAMLSGVVWAGAHVAVKKISIMWLQSTLTETANILVSTLQAQKKNPQ